MREIDQLKKLSESIIDLEIGELQIAERADENMYDIFVDGNSVTISNGGRDVLELSHEDFRNLIRDYKRALQQS